MLKNIATILAVLAIAIGFGAASVSYALRAREGVGAVTIGGWTAYPAAGTPDADPYSKARVSRDGVLALGRAEGLAFSAQRDSGGDPLRVECDYQLEGTVPATRFFTLHAIGQDGSVVPSGKPRPAALHSYQLLRTAPDTLSIAVGQHPHPGNWLPITGSGPMSLVLTLYDTPVASSTGVDDIVMPQIIRAGCDD